MEVNVSASSFNVSSLPMSNHDLCHFCNSITKRKRLKGLVALYTNDRIPKRFSA